MPGIDDTGEHLMHFSVDEVRLVALHARQARPLHETVRALQEALPELPVHRILDLAKLACEAGPFDARPRAHEDSASSDTGSSNDDGYDAESARPLLSEGERSGMNREEPATSADDENPAESSAHQAEDFAAARLGRESLRRRDLLDSAAGQRFGAASVNSSNYSADSPDDAIPSSRIACHPMVLGLNRAIGELRGERAAERAIAKVDAAIGTGKLVPAQREWGIAYCTADPAGFAKFASSQPALSIAGEQSIPAPRRDVRELTDDESRICTQTGTDLRKFVSRRNQAYAAMAANPAAGAIIRLEIQ
jgi:hypothetical protein